MAALRQRQLRAHEAQAQGTLGGHLPVLLEGVHKRL